VKQEQRENMSTIAPSPAARAVCGNSARADLCEGRRVTVVLTAPIVAKLDALINQGTVSGARYASVDTG